ncbi:MAG: RES family NAD+ phosphorylase [Pseudoruegeria sp.]
MVINSVDVPVSQVKWDRAVRIIRSVFPPIDLFEDIAEPEDWPLLISAEQKTNPRLMETIGNIDLIPATRRVGGAGASYLMAPFTHTSTDRPSRFSDGRLGVLYIANDFETAVHETAHHHGRFLVATNEKPGWVSQFRELLISVDAALHDIRSTSQEFREVLDLEEYTRSQNFADSLRSAGSEGVVYPSVRGEGECVGLFYPDLAQNPVQGRHLAYHWDGTRVDLIRDATTGDVFRIVDP